MMDLSIFKDYDIRGTYPNQINGEVAAAIAHAIVRKFQPKTVAMCRDMRLSGQELRDSFVTVFTSLGIDVVDVGVVGTEMQYYVAGTYSHDLVLMISASHNPPEYNGLKLVTKGPIAVTSDSGLYEVRDLIAQGPLAAAAAAGKVTNLDVMEEWRKKVVSLIDPSVLKPLSVVVDAGNGMAGKLVSKAFEGLPMKITPLYFELDGHFPNHVPNPLIEKNTADLKKKIVEISADVGLTFDGDADRMFLVDDKGRMVSGTITTAILAKYILKKHPGELILYNAICGRIVPKIIEENGGKSKRVRVGHSYIKTYMRETGAIFAGEHSGHYYFRDYFLAESGVLTALMVLSLLSTQEKKLSQLVDELDVYPASGEINFIVSDIPAVVDAIRKGFSDAVSKDEIDGISAWYKDYWFNVRASKTEPLLRLNVEADTKEILDSKTRELVAKIESLGGKRSS
ncbi:phosphomannomutase/phosphoglucomutase [Candidatus Gottesmanbacteria bacterium]|nr:phosphomannomutase/phosphoglucomutase [Candidatus Gottesmanbacteria bacterium]